MGLEFDMADSQSSTLSRPSAESVGHNDDDEELNSSVWSELPDVLVENLLSWLPDVQSLTRFRRVCNSWSRLFSSAYFINLWNKAHHDNNRCQPWLLLSSPNEVVPALVYSFTTNTWGAMRFSFLPEYSKYGHLNFKGSAGGLLLMDMVPSSSMPIFDVCKLCICNPLTESWISLPPMISITRVMASCITDPGNGNYIVMVLGKDRRNLSVVEEYESSTRAWKIMTTVSLPDGLSIRNEEMVFCNGFVLCITLKAPGIGILLYSMHSRSWTMVAMPPLCTNDHHVNYNCNLRSTRLLSCESKIFMVGGLEKHSQGTVIAIIIWQFEIMDSVRSEWKWKEIGRMPHAVFEDFVRTSCSNWFECVAVGKYMCFRAHGSLKVVVYNIRDCTWNWLPKYDDQHDPDHKHMLLRSMAYHPWNYQQLS